LYSQFASEKDIHPSKESVLHELDILKAQINLEKDKYTKAIQNDKEFEDVKAIYMRIKNLETQATVLMEFANQLHL